MPYSSCHSQSFPAQNIAGIESSPQHQHLPSADCQLLQTAAICIKSFADLYPYEKGEVFTADETYIKIRGIKTYIWFIMNTTPRSIIGYQVSDNRSVDPYILAMRMAFQSLTKQL